MNDSDYREWIKAHTAAFPGIIDWMRKQGADGSAAIANAWKSCLSDIDKSDAIEATRLMNIGDESAPAGFGDHARSVRKIARRLFFERRDERKTEHRTFVDGKQTFDCPHCLDKGFVEVVNIWRKKTQEYETRPLRKFLEGLTNVLPICAVPCSCGSSRVTRDCDRFNPDTMFVVDMNSPKEEEAERFREWWAEGRHLGSRVGAFDNWNRGDTAT